MSLNNQVTPTPDPWVINPFFHIDLGNILTILTFLITLYKFHEANKMRITHIEFRVGLMWKHFAKKFDLPENIWDANNIDDINHS